MLGRNGNIAYVRYDSQGRIVPGGPIISAKPPRVGNWQAVSNVLGTNTTSNALRAFIRVDYFNRVVPSSLVLLTKEPGDNDSHTTWIELLAQYRGVQESLTCTSGIQEEACTGCPSGGTTYVYTNTVPANGVAVFLNRNRTIPYDAALFGNYARITSQNIVYFIADGTNILTLGISCPTTTTTTTLVPVTTTTTTSSTSTTTTSTSTTAVPTTTTTTTPPCIPWNTCPDGPGGIYGIYICQGSTEAQATSCTAGQILVRFASCADGNTFWIGQRIVINPQDCYSVPDGFYWSGGGSGNNVCQVVNQVVVYVNSYHI